jgi:Co/Zn/Cd efflux system component
VEPPSSAEEARTLKIVLAINARHRHGGAHMKASWIFTTNDVIANLGMIVAAGMVGLTRSNVPDLAVATVIALVILNGAIRILRLKGLRNRRGPSVAI